MDKRLIVLSLVRIADSFGALLIAFVIASMPLSDAQAGILASSALAGMFFGAPILGHVADRVGRMTSAAISLAIYSAFTLLAYRLYSFGRLVTLRFLAGFGLGGALPAASTAFVELAPDEKRGLYVSLFESMRAYGTLIAALTARYAIPRFGRRSMFLIGAFPIVLAPVVLSLEETPYYKESRSGNRPGIPLTRTILVSFVRFALAMAYYGRTLLAPRYFVSAGDALEDSFDYIAVASLAMVAGYYINALIVDRVGRRATIAAYILLSGASLRLFALGFDPKAFGILFAATNAAARCVNYTYTPELYPTRVRGTAMGIAGASARIGGFLGPIVASSDGFVPISLVLFAAAASARAIGEETARKKLNRAFLRASRMMIGGLP